MIGYLLIAAASVGLGLQFVFGKLYNLRNGGANPFVYTFFIAVAVLIFYLCYSGFALSFDLKTFLCGLLFGACYCACFLFQLVALRYGPSAFVSLFVSYSLILPTVYGWIVTGTSPKPTFYAGMALLATAIFLIGFRREKTDRKGKRSVRWVIFALFALIANGMCSIIQAYQQSALQGMYKSELMIFAMSLAIPFNVAGMFAVALKKKMPVKSTLAGWWTGLFCGIVNALCNLCVMLSLATVPAGIVYPMICGLSLVVTFLFSKLLFHERLTKMQIGGFCCGVGALIFVCL